MFQLSNIYVVLTNNSVMFMLWDGKKTYGHWSNPINACFTRNSSVFATHKSKREQLGMSLAKSAASTKGQQKHVFSLHLLDFQWGQDNGFKTHWKLCCFWFYLPNQFWVASGRSRPFPLVFQGFVGEDKRLKTVGWSSNKRRRKK